MQNLSILIVDDNLEFHRDVWLQLHRFCVLSKALNAGEMRRKLASNEHFDLILLDLALDETKQPVGLKLIPEIRKARKDVAIIVATQFFNKPEYIVKATRLGARDFIDKNTITPEDLLAKIRKAVEESGPAAEIPDTTKADDLSGSHPFIGQSPKILELKKILQRIGQIPKTPVLITGETGTGKEVAARYLHSRSPRSDKPFIGINLSATPKNLLESALFGHVKGSFTDAYKDNPGFFREAHSGVLLLDEIGDISLGVQVKLLRAIEERTVRPVGSDKDFPVDVHLLTATHKKLADEVAKGNFRADLFQRLKTLVIEIPPLRERPEDLLLLLEHYLSIQDADTPVHEFFSKEVLDRFRQYSWPGNIRELRSAVEHCFVWRQVLGKAKADRECLPEEIRNFDQNNFVMVSLPGHVHQQTAMPTLIPAISQTSAPSPIFNTRKEEKAYQELADIEYAMQLYNKVKTDVAAHLDYKGTDGLRNRIRTLYGQFPQIFERFPLICQEYPTLMS